MKVKMQGGIKSFTGKMDNLIFYEVDGEVYARTRGERSDKSYSAEYLENQERMVSVSTLFRAIKAIGLFEIWQRAAKERETRGYNLFVKHNFYVFTDKGMISGFSKIHITVGSLELPDCMSIEQSAPNEWVLTWEQQSWYSAAREDDRLRIVMMEGHEKNFRVKPIPLADVSRKEGRAIVCRPPESTSYVHLYCYFASADNKTFSESKHFKLE